MTIYLYLLNEWNGNEKEMESEIDAVMDSAALPYSYIIPMSCRPSFIVSAQVV